MTAKKGGATNAPKPSTNAAAVQAAAQSGAAAGNAAKAPATTGAIEGSTLTPENDEATKAAIKSQTTEQPQQEGAEVIKPAGNSSAKPDGKPGDTVIPTPAKVEDEKTDGQKAEFVRAVGLFGVAALSMKDEDEATLKMMNDAKEASLPQQQSAPSFNPETTPIEQKYAQPNSSFKNDDFVADENHVIAVNGKGEPMRFTKTTWQLMQQNPSQQDSQDAWKLAPQIPAEVLALKK